MAAKLAVGDRVRVVGDRTGDRIKVGTDSFFVRFIGCRGTVTVVCNQHIVKVAIDNYENINFFPDKANLEKLTVLDELAEV